VWWLVPRFHQLSKTKLRLSAARGAAQATMEAHCATCKAVRATRHSIGQGRSRLLDASRLGHMACRADALDHSHNRRLMWDLSGDAGASILHRRGTGHYGGKAMIAGSRRVRVVGDSEMHFQSLYM
jgi:hypothetical protein